MRISRYRYGEAPRAIAKKRVGKLTVVTQFRQVWPFIGEPETVYETKVKLRQGLWTRDFDYTLYARKYESAEDAKIGHQETTRDVKSNPQKYLDLDIITSKHAPF